MGAYYEGKSEREHTSFSIQTMKSDTGKALNMLGDAICNPSLNSAELELLKEEKSIAMLGDVLIVNFCLRSPFANSLEFCAGHDAKALVSRLHK